MLQLLSTDTIEVVTSAAVTVDAVAWYQDATLADPPVVKGSTSGRAVAGISTATTTPLVAGAASTQRNIRFMTIRNKHATTSVDVTVQLDVSTVNYEMIKVTLAAGETLTYKDGVGFAVRTATTGIDVKLRVTSDYINATTSFSDITGLTYPVESGKHYNFVAHLFHIENVNTTGAQFGINGPAMTAMTIQELGVVIPSVTAASMQGNIAAVTALDTAAIVATASATTPGVVLAILTGWFNPSAAGTFAVRGKSEVAVAAGLTVKAGSHLRLWQAAA